MLHPSKKTGDDIMRNFGIVLLIALATLSTISAAEQPKPEKALTNADVIELANAKLGDDIVIAKINQAPKEELDISTDALIALKSKGIGNAVVDAMMKRVAARPPKAEAASLKVAETHGEKPVSPPITKGASKDSDRPCVQNFTTEGSFFSGKTYKTSVFVGKIDRDAAFVRAAQFIVTDGWRMATSNKETGIITATQDVNWSEGKTAPLGVVLKSTTEGLTIQVTFSTGAGQASPKDAVIKALCGITDAAAGS
jgi:hypothetical protein